MKKLLIVLALLVSSLISYPQDARIELLVHRDGGKNVLLAIEKYGESAFIKINDITTSVYGYNEDNGLATFKISSDGEKVGIIYIDFNSNRFTILLADGSGWNGDVVNKEQTI